MRKNLGSPCSGIVQSWCARCCSLKRYKRMFGALPLSSRSGNRGTELWCTYSEPDGKRWLRQVWKESRCHKSVAGLSHRGFPWGFLPKLSDPHSWWLGSPHILPRCSHSLGAIPSSWCHSGSARRGLPQALALEGKVRVSTDACFWLTSSVWKPLSQYLKGSLGWSSSYTRNTFVKAHR